MKAFRLFQQIISKGLDNSGMTEYRHSSKRSIQDFFGDYSATGKVLEDGDEFLAVWGDENGEPRIEGVPDLVLTQSQTEKIYLYKIESGEVKYVQEKSLYCSMVLRMMDTEEYSNNYCGALEYVLRLFPEVDRGTLEKELDKYI